MELNTAMKQMQLFYYIYIGNNKKILYKLKKRAYLIHPTAVGTRANETCVTSQHVSSKCNNASTKTG